MDLPMLDMVGSLLTATYAFVAIILVLIRSKHWLNNHIVSSRHINMLALVMVNHH